jgi:DNA-binding response OmpR family regulator
LVVSYQKALSRGRAQLRTAQPLAAGDKLYLTIQLADIGEGVEVPTIAEESVAVDGESERYSTRVRLDEVALRSIEQFIVEADPSFSEQHATVRPPRRLKVLIVDDSPKQMEHAAAPFIERGDEVITASDGLMGLALCLKHEPDIVLSDVQMPKADGWQLLRMIRARKQLATTPVIFLTTLSGEEDRLRGYRLGVDDYIAKPYPQDVLVRRVQRLLDRAQGALSWFPKSQDALRGDLEQVGLPALLSFLELERKSGVVYLEPKGSLIILDEGRPVRAKSKHRDSVDCKAEALHELLDQRSGHFEFVPGEVEEEDTIQASLSGILMEHARLQDEAKRLA